MLVAGVFLGHVATHGEGPLMDAVDADAKELAEMFTGKGNSGWSRDRWPDEVSMCMEIDAMTCALLTLLYKKRRDL
jgi:hypothetical protein